MPSVRTLMVSKDALKKLSNAAIDFDVRPHELVNAIVVHTNWEMQVEKLVKIIKDGRERTPESSPSPNPSFSPSLTESRVPPSPARVLSESRPSPQETSKSSKKTRQDSARVTSESSESSEEEKT